MPLYGSHLSSNSLYKLTGKIFRRTGNLRAGTGNSHKQLERSQGTGRTGRTTALFARVPMGRVGKPDEVAALLGFVADAASSLANSFTSTAASALAPSTGSLSRLALFTIARHRYPKDHSDDRPCQRHPRELSESQPAQAHAASLFNIAISVRKLVRARIADNARRTAASRVGRAVPDPRRQWRPALRTMPSG